MEDEYDDVDEDEEVESVTGAVVVAATTSRFSILSIFGLLVVACVVVTSLIT